MLDDGKYLSKDETNLRIAKILVLGLIGIVLIFFTSTSGCVMYLNSVEAEQTRAETEQIREEAKTTKMKVDAISALIDKGTNPIAARCAINGYTITISNGQVVNPCLRFLNTDNRQGEELK